MLCAHPFSRISVRLFPISFHHVNAAVTSLPEKRCAVAADGWLWGRHIGGEREWGGRARFGLDGVNADFASHAPSNSMPRKSADSGIGERR